MKGNKIFILIGFAQQIVKKTYYLTLNSGHKK